jgi:hypothetical protein
MLFSHSKFALPLFYVASDVAKAKLMSGYGTHFHAPPVRTYFNIIKISFIVLATFLGSSASKDNLIIQSSIMIKIKDYPRTSHESPEGE